MLKKKRKKRRRKKRNRFTETIRLIGDGRSGSGEGEITYLSLHCHHQNDSCIKVGSDESHFNV